MKTIIPADPLACRILGEQKIVPDAKYRPLAYTVGCDADGEILLYNNMTKCLLLFSPEEAKHVTENEALIKSWFAVPVENDDKLLAENLKEIAACLKPSPKHITSYKIFPTTDCNARCFYCFEAGRPKRYMSHDTAARTAKFIEDHCGGHTVKLNWFGGEPLLGVPVIDDICETLTQAGIKYQSGMVTNGYLFDETTVRKAVELWRLGYVQITLDGTEEVYNRTKAYAIPVTSESPFARVMRNIGLLLDAGITVSVRLNVGRHNADDLYALVDEIATLFGGRRGFSVYANPILTRNEGAEGEDGWSYKGDTYDILMPLREYIDKKGINSVKRLRKNIRLNCCMADNDSAVTVLPDGSLGRCEHYTESEFFGHIGNDGRDEDVIKSWKERVPEIPECGTCPYYPECIILKKCQCGTACSPELRRDLLDGIKKSMMLEYRLFCERGAASLAEDDTCVTDSETC